MKEAVLPSPPEPLRQDMHEDEHEEILARKGPRLHQFCIAVLVLERDFSVFVSDDRLFAYHSPVEVSGKILDCVLPGTGVMEVYVPFHGMRFFGKGDAALLEEREHLPFEEP